MFLVIELDLIEDYDKESSKVQQCDINFYQSEKEDF
jgi:hypothetical protein